MLQGILADKVDGPVNFVNVQNIAEERGITAKESKQPAAVDFLNLITVTTYDARGELSVSGTTLGPKHRPRLVKVYRQDVDIEPAPHMAFLRYADVPGMIGKIGTKVGEFGINIGQMGVGREVKDAEGRHGADARRAHQPGAARGARRELRARGRQAGRALGRSGSSDAQNADGAAGRKGPPPRRTYASRRRSRRSRSTPS